MKLTMPAAGGNFPGGRGLREARPTPPRAERVHPALAPFRPAFRKGQGAGAKGPTLALAWPRLATRLPAVDRQPRPQRWHENGAYAVASLRRVMGLGMHQQWRADVIPGERDVLWAGVEVFGPVVSRVAALREYRIHDGNGAVCRCRIEHALHRRLQPAGHGNIVGIDAQLVVSELALEVENVPGAPGRKGDAPEAGLGCIGAAVRRAEANKRILAG